jgi:hypothetical protein
MTAARIRERGSAVPAGWGLSLVINVGLTAVGVGAFVAGCVWWGVRATITILGVHIALLVWLLVVIGVAQLWARHWLRAAVVTVGSALTALLWSVVFVDFPPRWFESAALPLQQAVVWGPVVLTVVMGLVLGRSASVLASLALVLGYLGTFPAAIWNEELNVVGGWRMYHYPSPGPALTWVAVCAVLGLLGGHLGGRLKSRLLHRSAKLGLR